jgi:hypothetical protein
VTGTEVQLHHPDTSLADLVMFRIDPPHPRLTRRFPRSRSRPRRPLLGTPLIPIGNGPDRGSPATWRTPGHSTNEAQADVGDSGGAAFAGSGLAGS